MVETKGKSRASVLDNGGMPQILGDREMSDEDMLAEIEKHEMMDDQTTRYMVGREKLPGELEEVRRQTRFSLRRAKERSDDVLEPREATEALRLVTSRLTLFAQFDQKTAKRRIISPSLRSLCAPRIALRSILTHSFPLRCFCTALPQQPLRELQPVQGTGQVQEGDRYLQGPDSCCGEGQEQEDVGGAL